MAGVRISRNVSSRSLPFDTIVCKPGMIATLAKIFPTKGATLGSGLAASRSQSSFVVAGELRQGAFPAQEATIFSGAKRCDG